MHRFRKSLAVFVILLFFAMSLGGCAGGLFGSSGTSTAVPDAIVTTYEGVALSLNSVKMFIKGQEVSGKLRGSELDAKIAQWEGARLLFIQAGDALKASVAATSPQDQTTKMQAYNALLQRAAFEIGKLQGGGK